MKRRARRKKHVDPIRLSKEHRDWSRAVRTRDGWTCQHCGKKPKRTKSLHAHHIVAYAADKSLRFKVDNGISLCRLCHRAEHKRLKLTEKKTEHDT